MLIIEQIPYNQCLAIRIWNNSIKNLTLIGKIVLFFTFALNKMYEKQVRFY